MRFGYVCQLKVLAVLMLAMLTASCVKSPRQRAQPECAYGKNTDGSCRAALNQSSAICEGNFDIKESGTSCVFFTTAHPNGCQASGLHAVKGTDGCYVRDSGHALCKLSGLDAERLCRPDATAPCTQAKVSLYLEVQEEGFKPHIVFDPGEKAQAGAELVLDEQRYRGSDITRTEMDNGKTSLSMALKIPWQLSYTKEDGTKVPVRGVLNGVLNGSNLSKDNASRGKICDI